MLDESGNESRRGPGTCRWHGSSTDVGLLRVAVVAGCSSHLGCLLAVQVTVADMKAAHVQYTRVHCVMAPPELELEIDN